MDDGSSSARAAPWRSLFSTSLKTAASLGAAGLLWGLASAMEWHDPTAQTLQFLSVFNLLIAGFNLLPGLPLDGGDRRHAAQLLETALDTADMIVDAPPGLRVYTI